MGLVLKTHRGEAQLAAQVGQVGAAQVAHLDMLELLPDALVGIEVRRIRRQPFEMNALGPAAARKVRTAPEWIEAPSQITQIRPSIWCCRCLRKATLSALVNAVGRTRVSRRPVVVSALITDR